jgi:AmmeMemoRadiSam system protein A
MIATIGIWPLEGQGGVEGPLTSEDHEILLGLARQALIDAAQGRAAAALEPGRLPPRLMAPAATFVTLTRRGALRGCIGALHAQSPLAEDVRDHARAAACEDYRFMPVTPDEVREIEIEISILSDPKPLAFECPEDLLARLRPGIDGVILQLGLQRATFLPQVWEKVPDAPTFLSMLCEKAGLPSTAWRRPETMVYTYQVESFHEPQAHPV